MLRHYISAHEQTQSDRVSYFRFLELFLASKGSSFRTYFIFTAAGVVPCGDRKRLPVHHYNAGYIFCSFGIIGLILSQFENRVLLKPVLEGLGNVAALHYCCS